MRDFGNALELGRKRARTEDSTLVAESSTADEERATKISNKLSALLKEFPEMKFLIDFKNLQESVTAAVEKYAMNGNEESVPLYSLPDEILLNCLSYVGKGHYGVVGLVSKKLNEAYIGELGLFSHETAYLDMATSVQLTDYCINELCKSLKEKDELFKAAAVNGNVDILRYAVSHGYDLFPLVKMMYSRHSSDSRHFSARNVDFYFQNEDYELKYSSYINVNLDKLVERGHLHVLKYLHGELNYYLGLQRYCMPAIEYGKLDMLQWLQSIGCMKYAPLNTSTDFCEYAIKSGNLEVLQWLFQNGYEIKGTSDTILADAIRSKSLEMIQYCFDLGYNNFQDIDVQEAIKETRSVKIFRLVYELGFEFEELRRWCRAYKDMEYRFEIMKFLRSISVPWDNGFMLELVAHGTVEMIEFAHEDGCPWTSRSDEYNLIFRDDSISFPKLDYLIANGCTFDYENLYTYSLIKQKDFALLDYFVGKNSKFDNRLFQDILKYGLNDPWFEGISYLMEKGKDVQRFKSLEEVFHIRNNIDGLKLFHSLGLPWCLDKSRNTHLLSKIACFNDLEDVNWAYENGCTGGDLVPYVKEEWDWEGIRQKPEWRENQTFFVENGMLAQMLFEENEVLSRMNVKEFGDAKLESKSAFLEIDCLLLKSLLDHGYTFRSLSEKEFVTKEAFKECSNRASNEKYRKRFTILQQLGVRAL